MTDRPAERDPQFDQALARGLLSRRGMLAGIGATGLASLLAACGTKGTASKANPTAQAAVDRSDTEKVLSWSNWPEYIDVDEKTKTHPTLTAFTKQTGIKVTYTEDYNDNDEFFAKVQPQLRAGADTGRDVWCSTDWMVAKLIRLNWVQKLDKANIPNAKNLQGTLADVEFDPGRQFSLPWQSGFTGIGYNPKATNGVKVTSISQLLTDPRLIDPPVGLTDFTFNTKNGLPPLTIGEPDGNVKDVRVDLPEGLVFVRKLEIHSGASPWAEGC